MEHRVRLSNWMMVLFLTSGLLSGCASIVGLFTDQPIQEDFGKRSWGAVIDDNTIETVALVNIQKQNPNSTENHISVTSFNGIVLLTGQVTTREQKYQAEEVVKKIQNVREIYNEIEIAGPTNIISRTSDSWLTTKIKTKMIAEEKFPTSRIKVISENGVVYLMGIVTPQEADIAVDLVKSSYGVQKIVKVFEYIIVKN